ncbi:glycine betaine ABC transporter substrate-binding protein, partial [Staphylococcus aureus]
EAYPEIATLLEPIFAELDLATLQRLNGDVAVNGRDPRDVAADFLADLPE